MLARFKHFQELQHITLTGLMSSCILTLTCCNHQNGNMETLTIMHLTVLSKVVLSATSFFPSRPKTGSWHSCMGTYFLRSAWRLLYFPVLKSQLPFWVCLKEENPFPFTPAHIFKILLPSLLSHKQFLLPTTYSASLDASFGQRVTELLMHLSCWVGLFALYQTMIV